MRFVSLLLVLASLQLGCETRVSLGNPCRGDNECSGGLRCSFGRCRTECENSAECASGRYCLTINSTQGACTLPTDTCTDGGCEAGLLCEGDRCVSPCASDTCLAGTTCQVGLNVCLPPALIPDAGMDAAMSTMDAGSDGGGADAFSTADAACGVSEPMMRGSVCVGRGYACAVHEGGVRCWGYSQSFALGDGTDAETLRVHDDCDGSACSLRPVSVLHAGIPLREVTSIACGDTHVCALTGTGGVFCWGEADLTGTGIPHGAQAESVIGTGVSTLVAGRSHTCVQLASGGWQCWGTNGDAARPVIDGRLGTLSNVAELTPVSATDFARFPRLELGGYYTCGIDGAGVTCQGGSVANVCGDPYSPTSRREPLVVRLGAAVSGAATIDVHTGDAHACALDDSGIVSCWGANQFQVLANTAMEHPMCADASYGCRNIALPIEGTIPLPVFTALSHGYAASTCAIDEQRHVYCWGDNTNGQAGYPVVDRVGSVDAPVRTETGPLSNVVEVAVGGQNACARTCDGAVYCWGANNFGQLGGGAFDAVAHPLAMAVESL